MSKAAERWVRILQVHKNELQVSTYSSICKDSDVLQTEQGAMIEVGAVLGATLLQLNDDDVLEIKLIMHRKEVGEVKKGGMEG